MTSNDAHDLPANIVIRTELKPGDIGSLIYLHGVLYAKEHGWDHTFEAYVAGPLAEFAKSHAPRDEFGLSKKVRTLLGPSPSSKFPKRRPNFAGYCFIRISAARVLVEC